MKGLFHLFLSPEIFQRNPQSLGKKSGLPQAGLKRIKIKHRLLKNRIVRKEGYHGACSLRIALPDDLQLIDGFSSLVALAVNLSLMVDSNLQPVGKSVYYGSSHSVEPSGNLVSPAAELSPGVKDGKYNFYRRQSRLVVDAHGNSPPVVDDGNGIVRVNGHLDILTEAGQSLVHGIVHDLIDQVMQACRPGGSVFAGER